MSAFPFGSTLTSVMATPNGDQTTAAVLASGVNVVSSNSVSDAVKLPIATGSLQAIFVFAPNGCSILTTDSDMIGKINPKITGNSLWFLDIQVGNWTVSSMTE